MEGNRNDMRQVFCRIARENDRESFNVFFRHYHARLIRFAILFVPNYDVAEDIVSNALVKILKNRETVFLMEQFEGYLFTCVKHEALNYLKREKRVHFFRIEDDHDFVSGEYVTPLEKLIDDELREHITRAIESLSPKRRMVYKLVKDEGLRYKEVAELMDISERTVEVHLKLALKEVRLAVTQYLKKSETTPAKTFLKIAKSILLFLG